MYSILELIIANTFKEIADRRIERRQVRADLNDRKQKLVAQLMKNVEILLPALVASKMGQRYAPSAPPATVTGSDAEDMKFLKALVLSMTKEDLDALSPFLQSLGVDRSSQLISMFGRWLDAHEKAASSQHDSRVKN